MTIAPIYMGLSTPCMGWLRSLDPFRAIVTVVGQPLSLGCCKIRRGVGERHGTPTSAPAPSMALAAGGGLVS
jgi:hypothetical protein